MVMNGRKQTNNKLHSQELKATAVHKFVIITGYCHSFPKHKFRLSFAIFLVVLNHEKFSENSRKIKEKKETKYFRKFSRRKRRRKDKEKRRGRRRRRKHVVIVEVALVPGRVHGCTNNFLFLVKTLST